MQIFKKPVLLILAILLSVFIIAAAIILANNSKTPSSQSPSKQNTPQIIVSILPQKQIVEKITGDDFDVTVLIPPGFSPSTYDPTTQDIKTVSQADIYFRIGHISFEKANLDDLQNINSKMKVVDTSQNNDLREIEEHSHVEDDHDEDGNDEVEDHIIDPHVWLSPIMVEQQSSVIFETLVKTYPNKEEEFTQNYNDLLTELKNLDQKLQDSFSQIKGKKMLVYHPAFGYLARDYGFTQEYIEIEGKEPSIKTIQKVIDEAKSDDIKVIFVQKQFSQDSAQAIAENIDGVVVQIDPLDPDYFSNLQNMSEVISTNLSD